MTEEPPRPVEVFDVTDAEWYAAIDRRLAQLGLSREEVARQGMAGRCESPEVFKIWMLMSANRFWWCGNRQRHEPHEWIGQALRNDCWGNPPQQPQPPQF